MWVFTQGLRVSGKLFSRLQQSPGRWFDPVQLLGHRPQLFLWQELWPTVKLSPIPNSTVGPCRRSCAVGGRDPP